MAEPKSKGAADRELHAIRSILRALDGLDGESIRRVLDYVFGRLSIAGPSHIKGITTVAGSPSASSLDAPHRTSRPSIRDLREEKRPESSNQMAALVAYYLSEVASDEERKVAINTADLERYFKQAGFKLPKSLPQTLSNATAAGYFDPAGSGLYKLNAVGYNLVVHGLPLKTPKRPRKSSSKASRKRK
jgi:hypothetical protein